MELHLLPEVTVNTKPSPKTDMPEDPDLIMKQRKIRFGTTRMAMRCPYCYANMTTRMDVYPSMKSHLMAALLCLTGLWPCIPWIYCSPACLVHKHFCTNCDKVLGKTGLFATCYRRGSTINTHRESFKNTGRKCPLSHPAPDGEELISVSLDKKIVFMPE